LADVAVDQFGVVLEVAEGVLAEGGEEVPVVGVPVAVEGGVVEAAAWEVFGLPALGEGGQGERFGFAVVVAFDVDEPAAERPGKSRARRNASTWRSGSVSSLSSVRSGYRAVPCASVSGCTLSGAAGG
jgi:hypothetical protein